MKMQKEKPSTNVSRFISSSKKGNKEPAPKSFGHALDGKRDKPSLTNENKTSLPKRETKSSKDTRLEISQYVKDYIQGRDPRQDLPTKRVKQ